MGNVRDNCETFGKVWHALNATESYAKQRPINLNPPKCRYTPMNVNLNFCRSGRSHESSLTAPSLWFSGTPDMTVCR
jgi:hypothetical protein